MFLNDILYVIILFVNREKTTFLDKLKGWLERDEMSKPKLIAKLKMEISSLISLEIVSKGRPFSGFNYNTKFIESLSLSDKTVARRTLQLGASIESQIREKLINCENFSLCLDENIDISYFIFYYLFIL